MSFMNRKTRDVMITLLLFLIQRSVKAKEDIADTDIISKKCIKRREIKNKVISKYRRRLLFSYSSLN